MNEGTAGIGPRLREIRAWRGLSLRAAAGLAGCSASFLSRAERGETAVDSRSLIEGLADALKVAPSDLYAAPLPARDPISAEAHGAIEEISLVLAHNRLGHPFREQPQPWPQLEATLRHYLDTLVPACDYLKQSVMLPDLIEGLYAAHATDPAHRRDALVGLMLTLQHTGGLLKNLGAHGMPALAAMHMRYAADELEDPAWAGVAEWRMAQSSGGNRPRMLAVSLRAAEQLQDDTDPRARQAYGMLHLNAAMASAASRRPDDARTHLAEARDMVKATEGATPFGNLHFSAANWRVWRISVGVELGEGPRVAEFAKGLDVSLLPSAERRAMFYGEVARGLAQDKATRDRAVVMMRTAEDAAPQRILPNPLMRETVADLLRRAKRDAIGRELRGLAYRMGIAD